MTLGIEWPVSPQIRRPLDLPLQPLVRSNSPRHQQPALSLPQPEERGTENQFADLFLQEKPSSHPLDISPQHCVVDRSPPAAGPPPKAHVGNSCSRCGQFIPHVCSGDPHHARSFPGARDVSGYKTVTALPALCQEEGQKSCGRNIGQWLRHTSSSEPLFFSLQRCTDVFLKGGFQD